METDSVIRALLVEKADCIFLGVFLPKGSPERQLNEVRIALLDLHIDKCRERLERKARELRAAGGPVVTLQARKVG